MSFCKQWKSCFMLQPVRCAVLPLTLLNSGCSDGGVAPSLYSCSILKCVEQAAKEEKWNISIRMREPSPQSKRLQLSLSALFSRMAILQLPQNAQGTTSGSSPWISTRRLPAIMLAWDACAETGCGIAGSARHTFFYAHSEGSSKARLRL